MKKIEAMVPPSRLEDVRDALVRAGAEGMSLTEVKVLDQHVRTVCYRGSTFDLPFTAQYKFEVVVSAARLDHCVDALRSLLGAGAGPSTIVVLPLEDSVRIRTGEHLSHAA
jgi:nitrogen regulatory protein PII